MAYDINIDYEDTRLYKEYTHRCWENLDKNLCSAIALAKEELNYMLIDFNNDVHRAYVVDTNNGLTLWSSSDSPEYEAALTRSLTGSQIHSEHPSVYFDIDGVLGKWYADARGYSSLDEIIDPRNHYFRDIEPHPAAIELARVLCDKGADVCIISAADINTIRDKWEWISENLPFINKDNIFFCPLGADKADYVKGNSDYSVLIDDYNVNLDAWRGTAMKAINTVNSHQGKYPEFDIAAAEVANEETASIYIDEKSKAIMNILSYNDMLMSKEEPQIPKKDKADTMERD